ncbi:hypothetical protein [Marinivivus vitaminiproducens]|uniref:hypothetical protein n=1 Tax=Marinivivus vitaminiproducens TaxID=3035935 RepID=UPI00279AC869|nr:hypothetical protein P4R82_13115 [Geminicoccaceae bacterium SCSIO 64248]
MAVLALAACTTASESPAPAARAAGDDGRPTLDANGYLDLRDVPARPNLSYSVEQRNDLTQSLIGDRERARVRAEQIRREAGVPEPAALPPPPPVSPQGPANSNESG